MLLEGSVLYFLYSKHFCGIIIMYLRKVMPVKKRNVNEYLQTALSYDG